MNQYITSVNSTKIYRCSEEEWQVYFCNLVLIAKFFKFPLNLFLVWEYWDIFQVPRLIDILLVDPICCFANTVIFHCRCVLLVVLSLFFPDKSHGSPTSWFMHMRFVRSQHTFLQEIILESLTRAMDKIVVRIVNMYSCSQYEVFQT